MEQLDLCQTKLKKIVNINDIETIVDIMNGDVIFPQMDYEKLK